MVIVAGICVVVVAHVAPHVHHFAGAVLRVKLMPLCKDVIVLKNRRLLEKILEIFSFDFVV